MGLFDEVVDEMANDTYQTTPFCRMTNINDVCFQTAPKNGLFENACRPAKNDPAERDQKIAPSRKPIYNLPKTSPHQDS
jgi:hypothetical protein